MKLLQLKYDARYTARKDGQADIGGKPIDAYRLEPCLPNWPHNNRSDYMPEQIRLLRDAFKKRGYCVTCADVDIAWQLRSAEYDATWLAVEGQLDSAKEFEMVLAYFEDGEELVPVIAPEPDDE